MKASCFFITTYEDNDKTYQGTEDESEVYDDKDDDAYNDKKTDNAAQARTAVHKGNRKRSTGPVHSSREANTENRGLLYIIVDVIITRDESNLTLSHSADRGSDTSQSSTGHLFVPRLGSSLDSPPPIVRKGSMTTHVIQHCPSLCFMGIS